MKKVLHVGCGQQTIKNSTHIFNKSDWVETRLDIDPSIIPKPDIVADIKDLQGVDDSSYDAIYSSHNIEHLYPHEVEPTLKSFYRVLNDTGEVFIACPDLQGVAKHVAEGNLLGTLYESPAGPIAAIDILYGHRISLQGGKHYMAHKCGFTIQALLGLLKNCGFNSGVGSSDGINMWVNAIKPSDKLEEIEKNFKRHLTGEES